MSDSRITKSALLAELKKLQNIIALLKTQKKDTANKHKTASVEKKSRETRRPFKVDIEFIGDFDLIKAKAVNVSEGGISLKTSCNLPFEMRYKQDGKTIRRRAHLVWVKHTENGGYNFGLKFVKGKTFPSF
jgi:hypothetical protein